MTKPDRRHLRGLKRTLARTALACFAGILSTGTASLGRLSAQSEGFPRPGLSQPPDGPAAHFSLSAFRAPSGRGKEIGSGSRSASSQHQLFAPEPIRLRDDDPAFFKKLSPGAIALRVASSNALTWAMDRFLFYRDFPDVHKGHSEQKLYLLLYF